MREVNPIPNFHKNLIQILHCYVGIFSMSNVEPVERFGGTLFLFIIAVGTQLQVALFIEEIYMFIIFIGKF
jgi:hypothetical protein